MPLPLWSQDNIAFLHVDFLSFHRGEATAAFDDESQRECTVSVRWGSFAWIDELKTSVDGIGRERRLCDEV